MKIVSLLPAATEIVCALGLRDSLVGRSHECDFPADVDSLPALTRTRVDSSLPSERLDAAVRRLFDERLPIYMLDEARLAAIAPDVVVTQEACEVCAISYDQVARSLRRTAPHAQLVSLRPERLGDVLADIGTVAEACGVGERATVLIAELQERLSRVSRRRQGAPRPRVAVVEWLAPPMLAGHWIPDAIEAAGGIPVGPPAGSPSVYATWSQIAGLAADVIIVAPCGFDMARTSAEASPLTDTLRSLAPRVLLMDGNAYLNRPGPRLVVAVETIAAWFRGEAVDHAHGVDLIDTARRIAG